MLPLPYLVLMKLNAGRMQDWADLSRMMGWAAEKDVSQVRMIVAPYRPEDREDVESLIFLGRKERELTEEDSR